MAQSHRHLAVACAVDTVLHPLPTALVLPMDTPGVQALPAVGDMRQRVVRVMPCKRKSCPFPLLFSLFFVSLHRPNRIAPWEYT